MARLAPDFWLTNATGNPSHATTHYISFSNGPVPAGWRGSAAVYISCADKNSATLYGVSVTTKQSYTNWTYPTGETTKIMNIFRSARSNVAATQNFSGTVAMGTFGSAGQHTPSTGYWANQTLWLGVSVPDNAPSGWYYGKVLVKGTYSMPAGATVLSYNHPFSVEVRPHDWQGTDPGGRSAKDNWRVKTKHVAFKGNRAYTVARPWRHKDDTDSENPPWARDGVAYVLSSTRDHMVPQTKGSSAQPSKRYDEPFMWVRGDEGL